MKLLLSGSALAGCALLWGCATVQKSEPAPVGYKLKTVVHHLSESEAQELSAKYPQNFREPDYWRQLYRVEIEINRSSPTNECISKGTVMTQDGEPFTWGVGNPGASYSTSPVSRETGRFYIRVARTNGVVIATVDGGMKYDGKEMWRTKQELLVDASPTISSNRIDTTFKPEKGFVPDAETAVRIAENLFPIDGKMIDKEKPFKATLSNGVWTVTGFLPDSLDGVAETSISQKDGRILGIIHRR